MKIAICFNKPDSSQPDTLDILDEVQLVADSLNNLGYFYRSFAIQPESDSMKSTLQDLQAYSPDTIFNLVESFGSDPRQQAELAAYFENLLIPFTGSSSAAILATTDKTITKHVLEQGNIPSPPWQIYTGQPFTANIPSPWLCKPAWEDASVGINDSSVITSAQGLPGQLSAISARHPGQPLLLETFINGREFNVSVLQTNEQQVEILPPAELLFQQWPADKPRIVNYAAKWLPDSFEYQNTIRSFTIESDLIHQLKLLAMACWELFKLHGYARVDFRQDALTGQLYVIEVNANPGIAPDSGFIAAVTQSGRKTEDAIFGIVASASTAFKKKAGVL